MLPSDADRESTSLSTIVEDDLSPRLGQAAQASRHAPCDSRKQVMFLCVLLWAPWCAMHHDVRLHAKRPERLETTHNSAMARNLPSGESSLKRQRTSAPGLDTSIDAAAVLESSAQWGRARGRDGLLALLIVASDDAARFLGQSEAIYSQSGCWKSDELQEWPESVGICPDPVPARWPRARKRKNVKKPDPSRHADGTPSAYACGKQYCTGVVCLNPSVELVHGDAATCNECGSRRRFCATCNGFYDDTRVVCHEVDAVCVFARNSQHPLNHRPRASQGGRSRLRGEEMPEPPKQEVSAPQPPT